MFWQFNHSLVIKEELPHLDVPGRHQPPPLPLVLGHHDGDAVISVPGPVLHLTLLAAVGDGVTSRALGELLLSCHSLLTFEAFLTVCHELNEELGHLWNICKEGKVALIAV